MCWYHGYWWCCIQAGLSTSPWCGGGSGGGGDCAHGAAVWPLQLEAAVWKSQDRWCQGRWRKRPGSCPVATPPPQGYSGLCHTAQHDSGLKIYIERDTCEFFGWTLWLLQEMWISYRGSCYKNTYSVYQGHRTWHAGYIEHVWRGHRTVIEHVCGVGDCALIQNLTDAIFTKYHITEFSY